MTIQLLQQHASIRGNAICSRLLALGLIGSSLAGCYVIPIDQHGKPGAYAYAPVPAAPLPPPAPRELNLLAKLYPANDAAAGSGVLLGAVINGLNGHGTFTLNVGGETFSGEATRQSPQSSEGTASAYGARGSYVRCTYRLNHPGQGTGECAFSNGARYTLHLNG